MTWGFRVDNMGAETWCRVQTRAWNTADNGYTERYFELLKDAKVKGYLFAQQNYVDEALKR